eukprot:COSAG01_NODE_4436_length_5025_cov_3.808161_3_plen_379_part_00
MTTPCCSPTRATSSPPPAAGAVAADACAPCTAPVSHGTPALLSRRRASRARHAPHAVAAGLLPSTCASCAESPSALPSAPLPSPRSSRRARPRSPRRPCPCCGQPQPSALHWRRRRRRRRQPGSAVALAAGRPSRAPAAPAWPGAPSTPSWRPAPRPAPDAAAPSRARSPAARCNVIEAPWLANGGHGASLRHHNAARGGSRLGPAAGGRTELLPVMSPISVGRDSTGAVGRARKLSWCPVALTKQRERSRYVLCAPCSAVRRGAVLRSKPQSVPCVPSRCAAAWSRALGSGQTIPTPAGAAAQARCRRRQRQRPLPTTCAAAAVERARTVPVSPQAVTVTVESGGNQCTSKEGGLRLAAGRHRAPARQPPPSPPPPF